MGKKLTIGAIKKVDVQFNEKKEIDIQGYSVIVDLKFRPTKIQSLIDELVDKITYCQENNIEFDASAIFQYTMLLLVKYFSDVKIPDDFSEQLQILDIMIDNEFLMPIIDAFSKDEVNNVLEKIRERAININQLTKEIPGILANEVAKNA
jgi:hypothetical protein